MSGNDVRTAQEVFDNWSAYLRGVDREDFKAQLDALVAAVSASSETAPMLPDLCKALGWQGGTIHQVIEQITRMRAALQEITRGAGPYNRDPLTHADNCIESMKSIATGALEGDWNPE